MDRLVQRRLDQSLAWSAFKSPDEVVKGRETGTYEYRKRVQRSLITLIMGKTDKGEDLVLSAWIDPPLVGTADFRKHQAWKAYRQAPWWKKWLLTFRRQLLGF